MNKHIEHIKQLLEKPSYQLEQEAMEYLASIVESGKLKPKATIHYQPKESRFSTQAITLPSDCIGTHEDIGLTIFGMVQEDWYEWVNFFLCVSNDGKNYVVGDFEGIVYASSRKFYDNFVHNFEVQEWDYWDI